MKSLSRYGLILFTVFFIFALPMQASALTSMSSDDLAQAIKKDGLDTGIGAALSSGMNLNDILTTCIASGKSNAQVILVTLCVAGANNADLREAAMSMKISPLIFASAMDTCSAPNEEDTQAYTAAQVIRTARSRGISTDPPPEPYASPSLF